MSDPKPADDKFVRPASVARQLIVNVRAAIGDRTVREIAELCGLDSGHLVRILNGDVWPDLVSISRLEDGLGQDLWPRRSER